MEKIIKMPYEVFHKFYEKLNVPSKYDEKFLYELFENLIEEHFAKCGRKLINKSGDAEAFIAYNCFFCVEHLTDLK